MDPACLAPLLFAALAVYAAFVTWRWRVAVREAKACREKAKAFDKIAQLTPR